jgi:hypothetical protein
MRRLRRFLAAGVAASVVGALLAGAASAETQTSKIVVEFSAIHQCTGEPVEGETRVHMVITTSENPDGSTHVRIHQQTHGQSLEGVISGDEYVFNNGEDAITDSDIVGDTGRVVTRTEFIHQGEDLAFVESPGLDDFHQRLIVTISPVFPPTIESERAECR